MKTSNFLKFKNLKKEVKLHYLCIIDEKQILNKNKSVMAQVTQTSTRFYVGITDVESSVKCVQKREYSRNIDTTYLYNLFRKRLEKKSSIEPRTRTELWFLLASRL